MLKVSQITKESRGHDLLVKVLFHVVKLTAEQEFIQPPTKILQNMSCADILVGDETGCIFFFAVHEQVEIMKPGCTILLRNFDIEVSESCLRLKVNMWGSVDCVEPGLTTVINTRRNYSILDFDSFVSQHKPTV